MLHLDNFRFSETTLIMIMRIKERKQVCELYLSHPMCAQPRSQHVKIRHVRTARLPIIIPISAHAFSRRSSCKLRQLIVCAHKGEVERVNSQWIIDRYYVPVNRIKQPNEFDRRNYHGVRTNEPVKLDSIFIFISYSYLEWRFVLIIPICKTSWPVRIALSISYENSQ